MSKTNRDKLVMSVSTTQDRTDRVAQGRRAGLHGKTWKQVRPNTRRKAIAESRQGW